jgi:uncharacterized damage-inducible protein DinB
VKPGIPAALNVSYRQVPAAPFAQREDADMSDHFVALAKTALVEKLEQLHQEVKGIVEPLKERALWAKPVEPGNSIGHLVLHLTGNLNHFVGHRLGHTDYKRDREREFTEEQVPTKVELLRRLEEAVELFRRVVSSLSEAQLSAPYPDADFGTVYQALVRLVTHFALHRGQMSYLARLAKV